jgi:STE24 endopeptidase
MDRCAGARHSYLFAAALLVSASLQVAPFLVAGGAAGRVPPVVPPGLGAHYGAGDAARADSFSRPLVAGLLATQATAILALALVAFSSAAGSVDARWGATAWRWPARGAFLAGFFGLLWFSALPFQVVKYLHFQAFGLTPMSPPEWARVLTLGLPVHVTAFVLRHLMVFCCIVLLPRFWPPVAALALVVCLGVAPEFLRNRPIHLEWELRPLADRAYVEQLEQTARRAGRAMDFQVSDHSRRENTVNMHLCGHAARTYVVFTDTFLRHFTPREAAVCLAHELGHARDRIAFAVLHHLMSLAVLLAGFAVAHWLHRRPRYASEGAFAMVPRVALCVALVGAVAGPLGAAVVRVEERRADRYALAVTGDPEALAATVLKGARLNLERLQPPAWERRLMGEHPSVLERLRAAAQPAGDGPANGQASGR